ncbi:MAG: BREX-3 system phosphatase PglZ [Fibrobacterota bacterium]|nr:MAG: BREX-3 system phosphatase PglZ [Fibrobacterota bacterium]
MSAWTDRLLADFTTDVSRLWIVTDPDGVLLEERLLGALKDRGFATLPFEDSLAYRAEYETLFRGAWERGEEGAARGLILHLRGDDDAATRLPWDYLQQSRKTNLSLADLFPKLHAGVVRSVGSEHLDSLFNAHERFASQPLGELASRDFVLTHIYRVNAHLLSRPEEFWREMLRLLYRGVELPLGLAKHFGSIAKEHSFLVGVPVDELSASRPAMLRWLQTAWAAFLESASQGSLPKQKSGEVPFAHPDVWSLMDSLLLEGALQPILLREIPECLPPTMRVGVVQNAAVILDQLKDGLRRLKTEIPGQDSPHREWIHFARRMGELISRVHQVDSDASQELDLALRDVQSSADSALQEWVRGNYANLSSLPVAKAPVMLHHVPRYLSLQRGPGTPKVALVVFDGLSIDQWTLVRDHLRKSTQCQFVEDAAFAWIPTLTSVSRQALFSGQRPREFASSIETTSREPFLWNQFWQDQGLRANEVYYQKSLRRLDQLDALESAVSTPALKVVGLVVDMVDEIVHGATLGKRGVARQISHWCQTDFVNQLFRTLQSRGFQTFLTSDHGNVDAIGNGRLNQGLSVDTSGERVRTYSTPLVASETQVSHPETYRMEFPGLPVDYVPLFAQDRNAFALEGEPLVVHGGISVEELIVPFVRVDWQD